MNDFSELQQKNERKNSINLISYLLIGQMVFSLFLGRFGDVFLYFFNDSVKGFFIVFLKNTMNLKYDEAYSAYYSFISSGAFNEFCGMINYFLILFVPSYIFIKINKSKISDYFSVQGSLNRNTGRYCALVVAISIVISNITYVFYNFFGFDRELDTDISGYDIPALIIYFISVAILPPIIEEFVFRGVVLKTLLPCGKVFAIACSAVFFATLHSYSSMAFAFCAGIILGYLAVLTGNLKTSIVIHAVNNATSAIFSILSVKLSPENYIIFQCGLLIVIFGVALMSIPKILKEFEACKINEDLNIKAILTPASIIYFAIMFFINCRLL